MSQDSKLSNQEQVALKQSRQVWEMSQQAGWQEVLLPWLEDKLNQSFPDPAQFKSEGAFVYAAKVASVYKKVVAELLMYVSSSKETVEHLTKKEKGELVDKFAIK